MQKLKVRPKPPNYVQYVEEMDKITKGIEQELQMGFFPNSFIFISGHLASRTEVEVLLLLALARAPREKNS